MKDAQCFIELYQVNDDIELIISPNYNNNYQYYSKIKFLQQDLEFTKSMINLRTIAVWYIKPKPQC